MITDKEPINAKAFVPTGADDCCHNAAFIPCFVVEDTVNLKGLHDCLIRVMKTNTTYYIDHYYRQLMLFQGPRFIANYDAENNPENITNGFVLDYYNNVGIVFNSAGVPKKFDLHD